MTDAPLTLPGRKDHLGEALRLAPGRIFAVIDGAYFADLPGRLTEVGLEFFPLYLDETDAPDIRFGPHLVVCPSSYSMEQVRDVSAGTPSVIWWAWPDHGTETEMDLFRHLRRLALVDVPVGRNDGMIGPPRHGDFVSSEPHAPVLFRYADPDVVAALMPVLSAEQRLQFFGGAHRIIAEAPGDAPLVALENPEPEGEVPAGRIVLSPEQAEQVSEAVRSGLRHRAVIEFGEKMGAGSKARILDAFARAEAYELASKSQIWEFLGMDLRYGERFELQKGREAVKAELEGTSLPSEERLWKAELHMQQSKGEDKTKVSGTRKRGNEHRH